MITSKREFSEIRRLLRLLPRSEVGHLGIVIGIGLLAAIFETAGVASVLPFMSVVLDQGSIERYAWLRQTLGSFGIETYRDTVVAAGVLTIGILALGNTASFLNFWLQQTFIGRIRWQLAAELFDGYMRQPYGFHIQRDAASLTKVMSNDVEAAVTGLISPLLQITSRTFIVIILLGFLLLHDPKIAITAAVSLGGCYWLVFYLARKRQAQIGRRMSDSALERSRAALEGLGGVKELCVLGREAEPIRKHASAARRQADARTYNTLVQSLPRYILEIVAFGGIVGITVSLVLRDSQSAIPTLALYAFAGYRLMPAFQQIFASAMAIRFNRAAVGAIEADIEKIRSTPQDARASDEVKPLSFQSEIRLSNVRFRYPNAKRDVLDGLSLTIARNQSIGLVGRTGAGKTTLADLLLGLHMPTSGTIHVDSEPLQRNNIRAWRRRVGYVPQHVFLANATAAKNIAFGLADAEINQALVERAAQLAQADEFIRALPNGYETLVGERGVKLSGGQRQRLGIARALYHNPDVLVFDEATSSLDGLTEDAVMEAIRSLSAARTVILIAHRMRTLQACDRILMLSGGKLIADGSYAALVDSSVEFRTLAAVGTAVPEAVLR